MDILLYSTCTYDYNSLQYMYTLRLPGKGLAAVAWEGTGLRISVGIGGHIFFANIRHVYKVYIHNEKHVHV